MTLGAVASALVAEARQTDERRLLVLAGERDATYDAVRRAMDAVDLPVERTTVVGERDVLPCERYDQRRAGELLGTTRDAIVFDAHDACWPNALGRVVGAVDGGGLFVLLTPPLDQWPEQRDAFDETIAVPPFETADVTSRFRARLVETLRAHRGIAIVNVANGGEEVVADGLTHPAPRLPDRSPERPPERSETTDQSSAPARTFPDAAYEACLTRDQADVLRALEALSPSDARRDSPREETERDGVSSERSEEEARHERTRSDGDPRAVVVEADRGRGKSSAAGLAAGSLAAAGADVLVTAPAYRSAAEVFARARELLDALGELADVEGDPPTRIEATSGGSVRFEKPTDAVGRPRDPDVVIVDEAAALPVRVLERFLSDERANVAFTTTVHGYEGAGRGFSVRFRDRLAESEYKVTETRLETPVRYAAGDPVEVWAFHALLLDASPAADQLVADATPSTVEYRTLTGDDLVADENLLRETFGLLVLAHYRTEPNDLARVLDAPNLSVRALTLDGHVVSVALLAREGDLPADLRSDMYEGSRVRGNMLPDVLTSQLRDEDAGVPVGQRVMRIATHHAVRSAGLGSHLLDSVREEVEDEVDWLGVGYGATPELVSFWRENGYRTVYLSTTRNDASGEHSVLMLAPTSAAGRALHDRHAEWFAARVGSQLSDALSALDPDVVRAALRATDASVSPPLSAWEWRVVVGSAYGPGMMSVSPRPFRELALKQFVDPDDPDLLTVRQERLLVRRVLQAHDWDAVADAMGFHSTGNCMRALAAAYRPVVDAYGDEVALRERDRFRD